jgi:hypothetical protein
MGNNSKAYIAAAVTIVAALFFFNRKKKASMQTAGGGPFSRPNINVASVPMVDAQGNIIAVVPVVTPVSPTPGSTTDTCGIPTFTNAYKDANGKLIAQWNLNGNAYNAITVQYSNDGGLSWNNSTGGTERPRNMGDISMYAGGNTKIMLRLVGNCKDNTTTGHSSELTVNA